MFLAYDAVIVTGQTITVDCGTWAGTGTGGLVFDRLKLRSDPRDARLFTLDPVHRRGRAHRAAGQHQRRGRRRHHRRPEAVDVRMSGFGVQIWALPRTGPALPLPDLGDYTLSPAASGAGSVDIQYPADGRNFAVLHGIADADSDLEIEIRTDGTSATAKRAILLQTDGDDSADGAVWKFMGEYIPHLLSDACLPYTLGGTDADADGIDEVGTTYFTGVTPGTVWLSLITAAKARGALLDVTTASFTATTDSHGHAWAKVVTVKWAPGRDYLELLGELEDLGLCEGELTSARDLRIYNAGTRGVDRTIAPNQVVLERGRDQADAPLRHSVRDAGTVLIGAGKGIVHEESNASALARRGRRIERYQSYNNLSDAGTLTALTQAQVQTIADGTSEQSHELILADGHPIPGRDFDLADWVFSSTRSGLKRRRVAQWTVKRTGGTVTASVTLDDLIDDRNVRLARQIRDLQNGSVAVGTPAADPPAKSPAKVPATPTGLVASSTTYQDLGPPVTPAAAVNASYLAVTTHVDGTPIAATPSYRVRYRYTTGPAALNTTQPLPAGWENSGDGLAWLPAGEGPGTSVQFSGLSPAQTIQVEVAAVMPVDVEAQPYETDAQGRSFRRTELQSAWSAPFTLATTNDTTPPPAPSTPLVTQGVGSLLRATWDGKDATGAALLASAPDLFAVEVHLSTTANFTPDNTTYRDVLFGAGAIVLTDNLLYGVTYFVRLVAVDVAGNRSPVSAQGSGSPRQVKDGDIESLSVARLVSGTGTFDLLLAGRIKTGNTGARIEFDNASFRQYDAAGTLRTQFVAADGSALITGTIQSALSGTRWVTSPDGTMRLYAPTGAGYSAIFNNVVGASNELVLRGQLVSNQSGYLRVNSTGIAQQFGIPGQSVTAQAIVQKANVDLQAPVIGHRVDKRYATADGLYRRNTFVFNDSSGNDIPSSVMNHMEWDSDAVGLRFDGRNLNLLADQGPSTDRFAMVYNDGNYADLQCGNVYAPNVVAPSGIASKEQISDIPYEPLEVIRGARAREWQYREPSGGRRAVDPEHARPGRIRRRKRGTPVDTRHHDHYEWVDAPAPVTTQPAPVRRVGPMADDIAAVAPSLVQRDAAGNLALSYGDQIGVLWAAVETLVAKLDELTDRFDDMPDLPGRRRPKKRGPK